MVSCLKNLCIHDNRRNLAPNIVDRPPIIYPEDNNGGVLPPPPYFNKNNNNNQSGASFCDRAQKQCRPLLAITDQCEFISKCI